jgi:predicted metal-dependent peptidase
MALDAKNRLIRARVQMILDQPFFGTLATELELVERKDLPFKTAATDGRHLFYDPDYIMKLSEKQVETVVAHETLHIALGCFWRRGYREPMLWGAAHDFIINLELKDAGFDVPTGGEQGWLLDEKYKGWHTEAVYDDLKKKQKKTKGCGMLDFDGADGKEGKDGKGGKDGQCPCGGSHLGKLSPEEEERRWKRLLSRAAVVAQQAGKLPAGMTRYIDDLLESKVPWQNFVHQWVVSKGKTDYRWWPPNKRHIHNEMYLPASFGRSVGKGALLLDTSGSIGEEELKRALSETKGLFQTFDEFELHIYSCDAEVGGYVCLTQYDPWDNIKSAIKGGGGTCFKPVWDDLKKKGITPDWMVVFTDGDIYDLGEIKEPLYPVLWCLTPRHTPPPWGQQLVVDL